MSNRANVGRDLAGAVLAVLAVLALLAGSMAWWARSNLYDAAVIDAKANEIVASDDVQAAANALLLERVVQPALAKGYDAIPAGLGGLLQGVAGGKVEELATQGIESAVASQPAHDITLRLAAAIQDQLVHGDGAVSFTPSQIVAVLAPSLSDNRVVSSVVDFADSSGCCEVVLAQRDQLPFVWQHVDLIRTAAVALPFVALLLGALALLVSSRRRRVALVLSIGVTLAGVATLISVWVGGTLGIDAIGNPSDPANDLVRQAASTIYEISKRELVAQARTITLIGAAVTAALVAWIALGSTRRTVPPSPDGAAV